ncbi:MAG: hypothetical protein HY901_08420 [Deltaproteobacteria bacterium]|nr:hypothetical protein [Deltaproteobacteria bacterium]
MRATLLSLATLFALACSGPAPEAGPDAGSFADAAALPDAGAPATLYFVAIHNEPMNVPNGPALLAAAYPVLQQMVQEATERHLKLTVMLSAQWADYIVADAGRKAEVLGWKAQGHELAAHHHGIHHGNWDGYTDLSPSDAAAKRTAQGKTPETYHGTLADYASHLHALDPGIKSGCVNDEGERSELPDAIVYDTCSGFTNHLAPGTREQDASGEKGRNEYANTGTWKGIARTWLAHSQITNQSKREAAQAAMSVQTGGVFGAVLHSSTAEATQLYAFFDFLATLDPTAAHSRTLIEAIEQRVLPTQALSDELLNAVYTSVAGPGRCGDGVCDDVEKANPTLCPNDCP